MTSVRDKVDASMRAIRWCECLLIAVVAAVAGCGAVADNESDEPDLSAHTQAIIYGEDDRIEVFQEPNPKLRAIAQSSFVALFPRKNFGRIKNGDSVIATRPLTEAFQVCADARFAAQPTAADCSGVLIDDDLVLTAGHCFSSDQACERFAFMFDYFYSSATDLEPPMDWGDVYGCRRVVKRQVTIDATAPRIDYAVVQLDRPAVGRVPVALRTTPLVDGEPLTTLGCVSGLPAKFDSGAHVLSARGSTIDFFLLDSDTFQGSSGSGVFDVEGRLAGVLVRGGEDYVTSPDASCKVPKVVAARDDAGALRANVGEEATYVARAIAGVCASGWPSPRLCGTQARCGDGFCTAGETRTSCAADCACQGAACSPPGRASAVSPGAVVPNDGKRKAADSGCAALPAHAGHRPTLAWLACAVAAAAVQRRGRKQQGGRH
jgi:hypothetical protein